MKIFEKALAKSNGNRPSESKFDNANLNNLRQLALDGQRGKNLRRRVCEFELEQSTSRCMQAIAGQCTYNASQKTSQTVESQVKFQPRLVLPNATYTRKSTLVFHCFS